MSNQYIHEKCRMKGRLDELLQQHSDAGNRLVSVAMGDLATRYELIFEKAENPQVKYIYRHEKCRMSSKVADYLNEYSAKGYKMVFHVMGDMMTRHELFFEKQVTVK